jgi:hypothetical protein
VEESEKALVNEKLDNLKTQVARLISHFESEQRVTGNISKRVSETEFYQKSHLEKIEKFERILLNEGKGMTYRIDRLERMIESKKDNTRVIIQNVLTVAALIISIIAILMK